MSGVFSWLSRCGQRLLRLLQRTLRFDLLGLISRVPCLCSQSLGLLLLGCGSSSGWRDFADQHACI